MASTGVILRNACVRRAPCSSSAQRPRTQPFVAVLAPAVPVRSTVTARRSSNSAFQSRRTDLTVTRAAAKTEDAVQGAEVKPVVKIDNQSDNYSTIVKITYGDKLGELMDTIAALKNLGLNIIRAKLEDPNETGGAKNKFYVTDAVTGEKITSSQKIEEIRLTILNIMLEFHPESAEILSVGRHNVSPSRNWTKPLGANMDTSVKTKITVSPHPSGRFTTLRVQTLDRPGLLVDMVQILKDVSCNILSAEVDTIGDEADDTLLVSYHGEALNSSMEMLIKNALQYYLSLAELARDESY